MTTDPFEPTPQRSRRTTRGTWSALLLPFLLLSGCGDQNPAMTVGEVTFSEAEIRTLPDRQLQRLARITAVGLAIHQSRVLELGAPVLALRTEEALLDRLREEMTLEWEGVDDQVLEAQYQVDPEWELEVRHLVRLSERWEPDDQREAARRKAEEARREALTDTPFADVAAQYSEEPGAAERGGLLGAGREGTWVTDFWEAALALEEGEISPVVESEYGFHVLKLESRRMVPFPEARDRVASQVAGMLGGRTRWEEWVEEKRGDIELTLNDWDGVDPNPSVARWPGGELPAHRVLDRLPGIPAPQVQRFQDGDHETRRQVIRDTALAYLLLDEAEARGIELPAHLEAGIHRDWERKVASWSAAFGFSPELALNQLAAQSLDALTRTGQNVGIARDEVDRVGPALDQAYPVQLPSNH